MSSSTEGELRAVVDHDECFSFGYCVDLLPSVFSFDEEGKSVARDIAADVQLLREAVETCPREAISLIAGHWRVTP